MKAEVALCVVRHGYAVQYFARSDNAREVAGKSCTRCHVDRSMVDHTKKKKSLSLSTSRLLVLSAYVKGCTVLGNMCVG